MTTFNSTIESQKGKHFTYEQRVALELMLKHNENFTVRGAARIFNVSPTTISNEIKRGKEPYLVYAKIKSHKYSARYAQYRYEQNRSVSRRVRFFEDFPEIKKELIRILEPKEGKKRISIEVALFELSKNHINLPTPRTVYYNIEHGILGPYPKMWLNNYRKKQKFQIHENKKILGMSIEQRPEKINLRQEFGHWEIDLVIGKREQGKVLLTLLERVSNYYLVFPCEDKKAKTINQKLKEAIRCIGKKNFKSITTDNGSEFSQLKKLREIPVYYCHPYASWEKGANERHNRMLREFIPKGTSIESYSYAQIISAQDQINQYPRKTKNFKTPEEIYKQYAS